MAWLTLIIAGFFEVAFVTTMKLSEGFKVKKYTALTVLSGALSFYLLSLALTEKGRQVVFEIEEFRTKRVDIILENLDEADKTVLLSLIDKVISKKKER